MYNGAGKLAPLMKDDDMKNVITLTAALALLAGAAAAATSGTTVANGVSSGFTPAVTGYVSATVTSTASPRIALPTSSKTINALVCRARDASGNLVPRNLTVSGGDIVVATASGQASGTLAVGDQISCVVIYER